MQTENCIATKGNTTIKASSITAMHKRIFGY